MTIVTPKTDFYKLLVDISSYLKGQEAYTQYPSEAKLDQLLSRIYTALVELEGEDG